MYNIGFLRSLECTGEYLGCSLKELELVRPSHVLVEQNLENL